MFTPQHWLYLVCHVHTLYASLMPPLSAMFSPCVKMPFTCWNVYFLKKTMTSLKKKVCAHLSYTSTFLSRIVWNEGHLSHLPYCLLKCVMRNVYKIFLSLSHHIFFFHKLSYVNVKPWNCVVVVLVNDTLCTLFELLDDDVVPPLYKVAVFVELPT